MTTARDTTPIPNDTKREEIRKYFAKHKTTLPIILLIAGVAALFGARPDSVLGILGILVAIGSVVWLFILWGVERRRPSDDTIDNWLREDADRLKTMSLDRLNLDVSDLVQPSLVITGPILWRIRGVPENEMAWRTGKDARTRFSINSVTVIHFTDKKLSSYQCDYNFIRGAPLNEHDDEYYYKDVVSVSTREISTNYTLPNNQIMKRAQSFTLSVASGEHISVVVSSEDIKQFTGGEVVDTGIDSSIKAVRKVLGERKV